MRKTIISVILLCGLISAGAGAADIKLREDAPDRYIVVPGDTLWGIASRFLKDPWRWPQLWEMNRDQVKNPHLIYPGDVIALDKAGLTARVARPTVKLEPRARAESSGREAIPAIPASHIEPFLSQPLVIEEGGLTGAPRIVGSHDQRVVMGSGDAAFVLGITKDKGVAWQIYRPGKALIDPDNKQILGYEAAYLGEAKVLNFGEVSTVQIVKSVQEINKGDRLVPAPAAVFASYVPRAPDKLVKGRIISSYGSVAQVGKSAIVALNKGARDGLEPGHVLAVYRQEEKGAYVKKDDADFQLPSDRYGLVYVFRTFDKVSYALVMQAQRPINPLDVVQTP